MDIISKSYALPAHALHHAAQAIKTDGWIFIAGDDLKQDLALEEDSLSSFSRYWDSLSRDEFMADNGTYRYRRYSQFELCDPQGELTLLPHTAYSQPKNINTLNGGVDRVYPPLEEGFITHPLFTSLLRELGNLFNQAEGERCTWRIRLHPYRILTDAEETGKPTPEGLHRDGVDYIAMMLLRRVNVSGGITTVTDNARNVLCTKALNQPLDVIVADDHRVMHEVSPILCSKGSQGYRDVLVIAYERVK